jgi:ABC-type uncharacterized transport system ATPase subunit
MAQAEEMCDRVVMIHRGRKVLDERTQALRRQFDLQRIEFEPLDPSADLSPLQRLPGVVGMTRREAGCELRLAEGTDPGGTLRAAAAAVTPARIAIARVTLEDLFVRLVTGGEGGERGEELRSQLQAQAAHEAVA